MPRRPLCGVNLGGWLVLEKWMTPSVFAGTDAVDEYTLSQRAPERVRAHRRTYITQTDFAWLAAHGVELLRLPVGYWLFGDAEPFVAAKQQVDQAFRWAEQYGLRILLDVHGAPGSQNGRDNSGRIGAIAWQPEATLTFVARLCEQYGQHPVLWGIELLNEPSPKIPARQLAAYYRRGYTLVHEQCRPGTKIVIHDAFRPVRWYFRLPRWRYPELVVDHHFYVSFSKVDRHLPPWVQPLRVRTTLRIGLLAARLAHPMLIGEWSITLPVNNERLRRALADSMPRAFRGQLAACYWSYKTEVGGSWSYRAQIDKNVKLC